MPRARRVRTVRHYPRIGRWPRMTLTPEELAHVTDANRRLFMAPYDEQAVAPSTVRGLLDTIDRLVREHPNSTDVGDIVREIFEVTDGETPIPVEAVQRIAAK